MAPLNPTLESILADLLPAAERMSARRPRRGFARGALVAVAVTGGLASAAIGAGVLGSPAPEAVKRDFRDVDRGMPADLRQNVDVTRARAAAVSDRSTVYFAPRPDGGYCAELVTDGHGRGAVCTSAAASDATAISVTVPFTDPVTERSPVTVSGRVAARDATSVQLVYPDGATGSVPVSSDRFYVADVPDAHLAAVHEHGLLLIARADDGRELAKAVVPDDAITPQNDTTPRDPIETDLLSDGSDFTKLRGVRGTVNVAGVTRLTLTYPDGTVANVPIDGTHFRLDFPPARQDDFADATGQLVAYGADGKQIAERSVYSVAGEHRHHSG